MLFTWFIEKCILPYRQSSWLSFWYKSWFSTELVVGRNSFTARSVVSVLTIFLAMQSFDFWVCIHLLHVLVAFLVFDAMSWTGYQKAYDLWLTIADFSRDRKTACSSRDWIKDLTLRHWHWLYSTSFLFPFLHYLFDPSCLAVVDNL